MATHKSPSTQKRNIVIVIILVILALLIASQFEAQTVKEYQRPSNLAQKNSFLALSHLLKPHGIILYNQTLVQLNTHQLPDTQDILMLTSGGEFQTLSNQERLLNWIHKGGRLVVATNSLSTPSSENQEADEYINEYDYSDHTSGKQNNYEPERKVNLLDQFGVSTLKLDYTDPFRDHVFNNKIDNNSIYQFKLQLPSHETVDWRFSYILPTIGLVYSSTTNLDYNIQIPQSTINNNTPVNMAVQLSLGKGKVLVLNSDLWLSNDQFKNGDNGHIALQLLSLLKSNKTPSALHIFSTNSYSDTPNLIQWLWQKAPYTLLAAALCLLLWLWHYRFVSGPKLSPRVDSRRNLLEHLHATAWFIYRADKGATWIKQLNQQFQQTIVPKKGINQFMAHSRHFQSHVITRFNQLHRYNPFARRHKKPVLDPSLKDKQ